MKINAKQALWVFFALKVSQEQFVDAEVVQCGTAGMFCNNGGECPLNSERNCVCAADFFGTHCEHEKKDVDVIGTTSQPVNDDDKDVVQCGTDGMFCKNEGECPTGNATACKCGGNFYGKHCELEFDDDNQFGEEDDESDNEIDDEENNGDETDDDETDDDELIDGEPDDEDSKENDTIKCGTDGMYCHNGGECPTGEKTACNCGENYSGVHCEMEMNELAVGREDVIKCGTDGMFCENGGECPTGIDTACKCGDKFSGTHCEKESDGNDEISDDEMSEEEMNNESNEDGDTVQCGTDGMYCHNGGECPIGEETACDCGENYSGVHCEIEINKASEEDMDNESNEDGDTVQCGTDGMYCHNGGECPTGEETVCNCGDNYSGVHCEMEMNELTVGRKDVVKCGTDGMFCENGGECPTGTETACNCGEAFYGMHCELSDNNGEADNDIDDTFEEEFNTDCDGYMCYNGGKCIPDLLDHHGIDKMYCDCSNAKNTDGIAFSGRFCEYASEVKCGPSGVFCTNGGECPTNGKLTCDCGANYFGPHCEFEKSKNENIPECTLKCENEGICVLGGSDDMSGVTDLDHLYKTDIGIAEDFMSCLCPAGYGGKACDIERTDCGSHHCYYGGTCLTRLDPNNVTKHRCDCTSSSTSDASYSGPYCQYESKTFCTDEKSENGRLFCANGGVCQPNATEGCSCPGDFYGFSCEFKYPPLNLTSVVVPQPIEVPQPVGNHNGQSRPAGLNPAKAVCNLKCINGGHCRNGVKNLGIISHLSEVDGLSSTFNNDFEHCVCLDGFVGLQCEHKIEICPEGEHVCMHGSKCVKEEEKDNCDCSLSSDYVVGTSCEYKSTHPGTVMCNINEPFPTQPRSFCLNGGECKDIVTEHQIHPGCTCGDDWTGPHCEISKKLYSVVSTGSEKMSESKTVNAPDTSTVVIREDQNKNVVFLAIGCAVLAVSFVVAAWIFVRDREFSREQHQRDGLLATEPGRRGSNDSRKHSSSSHVNLAAGENKVYLGPPRDEDGNELHSISLMA